MHSTSSLESARAGRPETVDWRKGIEKRREASARSEWATSENARKGSVSHFPGDSDLVSQCYRVAMGAKTFEDLIAWQKSRLLAAAVSKVTKEPTFSKDHVLVNQILRAVRGIGANIAEGFERNSRREYIQYLSIAKGSASEVRAHLYHAVDDGLLTQDRFAELKTQAEEVSKILYGLRAALQEQRKRD